MVEDTIDVRPVLCRGIFLTPHKHFMKRALELAKRGNGLVSPNPLVGAVIVKNNGIIGEGYHKKYGSDHAEIMAIKNAKKDIRNTTMYVTLEPCNHQGKTPACAPELVRVGLADVIIATLDPNPLVSGSGIQHLQQNGINVISGILEKEARELNQPFLKSMLKKHPYIMLKTARTLDGFIADSKGKSQWISSIKSRTRVHRWRSEYDAVMVGIGTVLADDPELTTRLFDGKNPVRIIIDSTNSFHPKLKMNSSASKIKTIVIHTTQAKHSYRDNLKKHHIISIESEDFSQASWDILFKKLLELNIQSIMVEGGTKLQTQLMDFDFVDTINIFMSPQYFGEGLPAFPFPKRTLNSRNTFLETQWEILENDILFSGRIKEY